MGAAVLERRITKEEVVGPQAFNIEYERDSSDVALYADIVSYLGEYRLQVQKYNYSLQFSGNSIYDLHLRDPNDAKPMYQKAQRAIQERIKDGFPTHREEAELEALGDPDNLSDNSLAYQLLFAKTGDTLIWASPPGPSNEGYGDYGFVFVGRVNRENPLSAQLSMTAIRVDNPKLNQYNSVVSELLGKEITFTHEDEFLAHPFVCQRELPDMEIDNVLRRHFDFTPNKEDQLMFYQIMQQMQPAIREFMRFVKTGTKEEKLKAFYSLENYALELKEGFKKDKNDGVIYIADRPPVPLEYLIKAYGFEPPMVMGSCGASIDSIKSNNIIINGLEALRKALFGELYDNYGSRTVVCPVCSQTNIRPENQLILFCQHCNSDKVACGPSVASKEENVIFLDERRKKKNKPNKKVA